jgi:drug/metabolite transporter (DMT)-like permease
MSNRINQRLRFEDLSALLNCGGYLPGIGFCISSAAAFIAMSGIVRNDGPALATFLTYGITSIFFIFIGFHRALIWIKCAKKDVFNLLLINILTIANTFLVYLILLSVSAFTYVIVFFGVLPACSAMLLVILHKTKVNILPYLILMAFIIFAAYVSSQSESLASLTGIGLSVVSAMAGAAYLDVSKKFQIKNNIKTSDVLALRFIGTILISGVLVANTPNMPVLSIDYFLVYGFIALIGSIIPLFLLQKSNEYIGPVRTARMMPLIPLLCILLTFIASPNPPRLIDLIIIVAATLVVLIVVHRLNDYSGD